GCGLKPPERKRHMTVTFATVNHHVAPNDKGVIQQFLEKDIDNDLDVKVAAKAKTAAEGEARVVEGWHQSGAQEHLTVQVWLGGPRRYTAHVSRNGQITAFT